jgi:flagellar motor component MotA
MSIIGLLVVFISLGVGIAGEATTLIDNTSLFITFGGAIGLLLFSGTNISAMFKGAFSNNATADELRAGARGWELFGIYALVAGAIGTLIGLVIMLALMDDPAAVPPAMAICLLTHVYGFGLALLISMPLRKKLEISASAV